LVHPITRWIMIRIGSENAVDHSSMV